MDAHEDEDESLRPDSFEQQKPLPQEAYTWLCSQEDNGGVCGAVLRISDRFCPDCGNKVGTPICKHCGSILAQITKFCTQCGKRLLPAVCNSLPQTSEPEAQGDEDSQPTSTIGSEKEPENNIGDVYDTEKYDDSPETTVDYVDPTSKRYCGDNENLLNMFLRFSKAEEVPSCKYDVSSEKAIIRDFNKLRTETPTEGNTTGTDDEGANKLKADTAVRRNATVTDVDDKKLKTDPAVGKNMTGTDDGDNKLKTGATIRSNAAGIDDIDNKVKKGETIGTNAAGSDDVDNKLKTGATIRGNAAGIDDVDNKVKKGETIRSNAAGIDDVDNKVKKGETIGSNAAGIDDVYNTLNTGATIGSNATGMDDDDELKTGAPIGSNAASTDDVDNKLKMEAAIRSNATGIDDIDNTLNTGATIGSNAASMDDYDKLKIGATIGRNVAGTDDVNKLKTDSVVCSNMTGRPTNEIDGEILGTNMRPIGAGNDEEDQSMLSQPDDSDSTEEDVNNTTNQDLHCEQYRKSEAKEGEYVHGKTKKKKKKRRNKANNGYVDVTFHVIVESAFHYNEGKPKVYIVFGDENLGKWTPTYELKMDRNLTDGAVLMSATVKIQLHTLRKQSPFYYKYCFIRDGRYWENIKDHPYSSNRLLKLEHIAINKGNIHQYDGVMLLQPEKRDGLLKKIGNALKKAISHNRGSVYYKNLVSLALREMLPTWTGFCLSITDIPVVTALTAQQALAHIHHLRYCMMGWPISKYLSESEMIIFFNEVLKAFIHPRIERFRIEDDGMPAEQALRMASAMAIVVLVKTYNLWLKYEDIQCVLSALTVRCDIQQRICHDYNGLVNDYFQGDESLMAGHLKEFLKSHVCKNGFKWLCCVPLIHFLEQKSKPFEVAGVLSSLQYMTDAWWGMDGLKSLANITYSNFNLQWSDIQDVLNTFTPLWYVDSLLPRVVLAISSIGYLKTPIGTTIFSPEALLAKIAGHIKISSYSSDAMRQCLEAIREVVLQLPTSLPTIPSANNVNAMVICNVAFRISIDILKHIMGGNTNGQFVSDHVIYMLKNCVHVMQAGHKLSRYDEQHNDQLDELKEITDGWLVSITGMDINQNELDVWNGLLQVDMTEGDEAWKDWLMIRLKERIVELTDVEIWDIFAKYFHDGHAQPMVDCFTKNAFSVLTKTLQKGEYIGRFVSLYTSWPQRVWDMVSKVFTQIWPKTPDGLLANDNQAVLKHIIAFPALRNFLDISAHQAETLSEECQKCLDVAKLLLVELINDIATGQILMRDLRFILENKETFLDNVQSINKWTQKVPSQNILKDILENRNLEQQELFEYKERISDFLVMCNDLNIVLFEFKESLEKIDMGLKISALCEPIVYIPEKQTFNRSRPRITLFGSNGQIEQILKCIIPLKHSIMFNIIWKEVAMVHIDKARENPLTAHDVFGVIWPEAQKVWNEYRQQMRDGSITLEKIDCGFKQLYKYEDKIKTEQKFVFSEADEVALLSDRMKQIQDYASIVHYRHVAQVLFNVKNKFHLTGNTSYLDRILDVNVKTATLNSITCDMATAFKTLDSFKEQDVNCISSFIKCETLVKWLRTNIKELNQLKPFVDLALISASGKDGQEVTRVSHMHAAISGFAPLIFKLKENMPFSTFIRLYQSVQRAHKGDEQLSAKLEKLNTEYEWLKGLHETQGDVGLNAINQVSAINTRGIFIVGSQDGKPFQNIEDVIHVCVPPEKGGKKKGMNYSLSALDDLQSKLMLIAGRAEKGNYDVDGFIEKFTSIKTLGTTLVDIFEAGNILFQTFSVKFYCSEDKSNVIIDFGLSDNKITGYSNEASVIQQIKQVQRFIEECLSNWKNYIEAKRTDFSELNHFTSRQLVILRVELAHIVNRRPFDHRLFGLLKEVCAECSMKKVELALRLAWKSLIQDAKVAQIAIPAGDQVIDEELKNLEHEYGKDILQCALRRCDDPKDIIDVEYHCEEIKKEQTECNVEVCEEYDQTDDLLQSIQINYTMKDITAQFLLEAMEQKTNLKDKLSALWDELHEVSMKSMTDYLSFQHLGLILKHIADEYTYNRALPPYLQRGIPNLIVCPYNDILNTVMCVYMQNENLPLPSHSEVLLCDEATNFEAVELLLRRMASDNKGRIFMLVHAQQLNNKVASAVEKAIETHMQGNDNYQFVVICSIEKQKAAHLANALEYYRVDTPIRVPLKEICAYLKHHLCTLPPTNRKKLLKASDADPEKCCVRVVQSDCAGSGKSLWVKRCADRLNELMDTKAATQYVFLPLHGRIVDASQILDKLLRYRTGTNTLALTIYHIDIPHEMETGVDHLLFNLVVLGSLVNSAGYVWHRSPLDLYIIETFPLLLQNSTGHGETVQALHRTLKLLPTIRCRSPQESLTVMQSPMDKHDLANWSELDQFMDKQEFVSEHVQRVFKYLSNLHHNDGYDLFDVDPYVYDYNEQQQCLTVLLTHCGLQNPSWAELSHFVHFLNEQLTACERCNYTRREIEIEFLPGFLAFVVRFMIQMSRDFSTRSLQMLEEPNMGVPEPLDEVVEEELLPFQMKRHWETSHHPYIFFNPDLTFTFMGFAVDETNYDLIDPRTNEVLQEKIMKKPLYDRLVDNKVLLKENLDKCSREEQIAKLCTVMGKEVRHDLDDKYMYVLTGDNVKKILAIHMRLRCKIPVVIMGETGCGKTELIKFMCRLQRPPDDTVKNLVLMKVHGGTTEADIIRKVKEAEDLAIENDINNPGIQTVLFMDEVNTTEALSLVKEVLCDHSLNGEPLRTSGLCIVAACNPYRKHTQDVIERLEQAGLGYHIRADCTTDKLGRIPMRHLVYRVQRLPQSLRPYVWDFGQLPRQTEYLYIHEIVRHKLADDTFRHMPPEAPPVITNILCAAQGFMREQRSECSFVSLRDVNRTLDVMAWFYSKRDVLFPKMDERAKPKIKTLLQQHENKSFIIDVDDDDDDDDDIEDQPFDAELENKQKVQAERELVRDMTRALILALGVCYHASLQDNRFEFREHINEVFEGHFKLPDGAQTIEHEISICQDVVLDEIKVGQNIARNLALKENVFMMVICIELRIPLFLVGKPGSSKSLAKTIVRDAMQGRNSQSDLFKSLKEVIMISYQCSPMSTPEGIITIFNQCAQLQKECDLNKFVAVVVLDEIGLAEDSPQMPLKTLHPLLETGTEGDDEADYNKVAFIGISNWALDPAKMNRGILVQRDAPDQDELEQTARDICKDATSNPMLPLIRPLAAAYSELYSMASGRQEFYGLRDFYSLVKMVWSFTKRSGQRPTWEQMKHCIMRNFSGLDTVDPVALFYNHLQGIIRKGCHTPDDPDNSPNGLITASISGSTGDCQNRYLLVLTENYSALQILQYDLDVMRNATVIFGSSFPKDQRYDVVCRNINHIKICMGTGQTVVLLNLESLYESLYDVLNQYYTISCGQRHVDLGLGNERVKALVHQDFKLIVVADKDVVYKKFPIPLINRLEKHFVAQSTMLTQNQQAAVGTLSRWMTGFTQSRSAYGRDKRHKRTLGDIFIGYHKDTCASVVMQVCQQLNEKEGDEEWQREVVRRSKELLLQCATPDAILPYQKMQPKKDELDVIDLYFNQQQHDNLADLLQVYLQNSPSDTFTQVTTHSRILSSTDVQDLAHAMDLPLTSVNSQILHAFDTEQQFSKVLSGYFTKPSQTDHILLIQCDSGNESTNLIECARHMIQEEYKRSGQANIARFKRHIVLIIQLPRVSGGCFNGFQGGIWHYVHLDDLRPQTHQFPPIGVLMTLSISSLFHSGSHQQGLAHFDSDVLIQGCVLRATAMLKDKSNAKTSTARIPKVLALLAMSPKDSTDGKTFRSVLKVRIHELLEDKEHNNMGGSMAKDWLIAEVADVNAINRWGTFRQSLWENLLRKISPIMAGILALVDINNNMKLIGETEIWIEHMWLNIFSNKVLTPLTYNNLISLGSNRSEPEFCEIVVPMKGANGTAIDASLPFSWLIKEAVDDLVSKKTKQKGGHVDVVGDVAHLMTQSPWWVVLSSAFMEVDEDVVVEHYLDDFVKMVYKPQSNDEYQLVKEAISRAITKIKGKSEDFNDEEDVGPEHKIALIHMAEISIHNCLEHFGQIAKCYPNVIGHLIDLNVVKDQDMPLSSTTCLALDILSVQFVVEIIMKPKTDILRDKELSRKWQLKVEDLSSRVNTVLGQCLSHAEGLDVVKDIRSTWTQIWAVSLFVEMVCPEGSDQHKEIILHGPILFKKLNRADFKTQKTMNDVEDFLLYITKKASKALHENIKKCPGCNEPLLTSVVMPCGHEVCENCLERLRQAGDFSCYECKKPYPQETVFERRENSIDQVQKLQKFKQRCNSFLMEVVSQKCFEGQTPPEPAVIEKLLNYITKEQGHSARSTKAMSLFDDKLDHTPIVRSVLLQLLLRSSIEDVHQHLVAYFKHAHAVSHETNRVELSILYIQCVEDHLYNRAASITTHKAELRNAAIFLHQSRRQIESEDQVEQLYRIAQIRFGLNVAAKWMISIYVRKEIPDATCHDDFVKLLAAAKSVCTGENQLGPGMLLIRQLVQRYGMTNLQQVALICPWVIPEYARPDEDSDVADPLVVVGPHYTHMQKVISDVIIDGKVEPFGNAIAELAQEHVQPGAICRILLLVIFRKITSMFSKPNEDQQLPKEVVDRLQIVCESVPAMAKYKLLMRALITNTLAVDCPQMTVIPGHNAGQLAVLEVVVHFLVTMETCGADNPILKPIMALIINPASMQNCFLPTMPEDMNIVVHQAILDARRSGRRADENQHLYECPNGHVYIIGNCGRPLTTAKCNTCGVTVGGSNHRVAAGNRALSHIRDTTQPGHCLGIANSRSPVAVQQRSMTPACCALVRLLIHLAMYAGANYTAQAFTLLIKPNLQETRVADFIWEHIQYDIAAVSDVIGKNTDDTLMLTHLLIDRLAIATGPVPNIDVNLTSKASRSEWEAKFSERFVTPLLKNLEELLKNANQEVTRDQDSRQDNNILRRLVYEMPVPLTDGTNQDPAIWRYRTRVSIDHLKQQLLASGAANIQLGQDQQHEFLHYFLNKEVLLRAVRYIPSVLKLVRILSERYHRIIDHKKAEELTVNRFIESVKQDNLQQQYKALYTDFCTAWTAVHTELQNHGVMGQVLKAEYRLEPMTLESPLSTLLPSERGRGMCTIALLDYLISLHNDIIYTYTKITKSQRRQEINSSDVSSLHLIAYDAEVDLLPMVVANCTYSLEMGQGTRIEYNFAALERQLIDRFIKGKPIIQFQRQLFCFHEDLNNAALFKDLHKGIPQVALSADVEKKLQTERRNPDTVTHCLSQLDIIIGFLVSVGGEPETLLADFMTDVLQMDNNPLTPQARAYCKLCHSKALWLFFSLEHEKRTAAYKQELFTSVDSRAYHEVLPPDVEEALKKALVHMNVESFLAELHECIVLQLTVNTDLHDEGHLDLLKQQLSHVLYAYIEGKDGEPPQTALTNGSFPAEIKVAQCVAAWRVAYSFLYE